TRQTITLGELLPLWWGEERAQKFEEESEGKA
ncbi:cytidine deaminase, partial [Streptococcus thermophilus MTCC 5460]